LESPAFRGENEIGASGKRPTIPEGNGAVARAVFGGDGNADAISIENNPLLRLLGTLIAYRSSPQLFSLPITKAVLGQLIESRFPSRPDFLPTAAYQTKAGLLQMQVPRSTDVAIAAWFIQAIRPY
jgi:hypothetical protein